MGAADGKIAVGLAGIAPPALLVGVIVQGLALLYARLRGRGPARLAKRHERLDLVILDPPGFSRTKSRTFSAARDYSDLADSS